MQDMKNGAVARHSGAERQGAAQKVSEFRRRHLTGRHRKLPKFPGRNVPFVWNIVGRVGDDLGYPLAVEKGSIACRLKRIPVKNAVIAQHPQIARL